jgi:hypothetical protein
MVALDSIEKDLLLVLIHQCEELLVLLHFFLGQPLEETMLFLLLLFLLRSPLLHQIVIVIEISKNFKTIRTLAYCYCHKHLRRLILLKLITQGIKMIYIF